MAAATRPVGAARGLGVLAAALVLASCTTGAKSPQEQRPHGVIAFVRDRCEGVGLCREPVDLYVMDADGGGVLKLIEGSQPAWSPDGTRIAFGRNIAPGIWVMNADGSGQARLTTCKAPICDSHAGPTWSPDGTRIAFIAQTRRPENVIAAGFSDLYVMNADGSGLRALTSCRRPDCTANFMPSWSPAGDEIAFWSMIRLGDRWAGVLRTIEVASGEIRTIYECPGCGSISRVSWSPSGEEMVFAKDRRLVVMRADGSGLRRLTECDQPSRCIDLDPSWSPDGEWIAFVRFQERGRTSTIHVIRSDGTGLRSLDVEGFQPAWRPVPRGSG